MSDPEKRAREELEQAAPGLTEDAANTYCAYPPTLLASLSRLHALWLPACFALLQPLARGRAVLEAGGRGSGVRAMMANCNRMAERGGDRATDE